MRDQASGRPDLLSLALAEPTGRPAHPDPDLHRLILILIYTGSVVVASIIGGIISDRTGRRKITVAVSRDRLLHHIKDAAELLSVTV